MFISLVRTFVVLHMLGAAEYGLVGLTTAVGGIVTLLQHLGLGFSAAKEAAQSEDKNQLGVITIVLLVARLLLLVPLLLILVLFGAPSAASIYGQPGLDLLIRLYALFLLTSAPGDILGYVLTGNQRYPSYFGLRIFDELSTTLMVVVGIWTIGVPGYFGGQAVAGGIYTLIAGVVVWRLIGRRIVWPGHAMIVRLLKSVVKTSLAIYVGKLSRGFAAQVPTLVGGLFLPPTVIGWFRFAVQAGTTLGGITSAVTLVTMPRMTQLRRDFGVERLCRDFATNYKRVTWGLACVVVLGTVFSPELTMFLGGSEFLGALHATQLIMVSNACFIMAESIFSGLYFPLDRELKYVVAYGALFAVAPAAAIVLVSLIPTAEGMALSSVIAGIVLLVAAIWQVRDLQGVIGSLVSAGASLAVIALISLSSRFFEPLSWRLALGAFLILLIIWQIQRSDTALWRRLKAGASRIRLALVAR